MTFFNLSAYRRFFPIWKYFLIGFLFLIFCPNLKGQTIELACPVGTGPWQPLVSRNPNTGGIRQYGCVDLNGKLTLPNFSFTPQFDALSFGATVAHAFYNCSATNGASPQIITCPSANFTYTVVPGMTAWCQAANGGVFVNGTNCPIGIVLSIQSDSQMTVTGTVAALCSANCAVEVGFVSESASNPFLTNFYNAVTGACGQGLMPQGDFIIKRAMWNDFQSSLPSNTGCQQQAGRNTRQTPGIIGRGSTLTRIVFTPDFDTSGCTFTPSAQYSVPGCIGCPTNGFGLLLNGITFTGMGTSPLSAGSKAVLCSGVIGQNWTMIDIQCTGLHGFRYGLDIGGGTTVTWGIDIDGCGGDDTTANQGNIIISGDDFQTVGISFAGDSAGPGLVISAGGTSIVGGQICSAGSVVMLLLAGAQPDIHAMRIGGNPCPLVNNQVGIASGSGIPELNMYGGQIDAGTGGTGAIDVQATTGNPLRANFSGVWFVNRAGSTCFNAISTIVMRDIGNNRLSCATFLTGAGVFSRLGFGSEGRNPLNNSNLTLTGWGTGASSTCANFSTNSLLECTITVGTTPGTNPTIAFTWTNNADSNSFAGFGIIPSSMLTQVGGTQGIVNWTRTVISTTGATFQFNGTPTAANTVIVRVQNGGDT